MKGSVYNSGKIQFSIETVLMLRGKQEGYIIKINGKTMRLSQEKCFSYFKDNNYECTNAVLVNNKYIRGKQISLKKREIIVKQPVSKLINVYKTESNQAIQSGIFANCELSGALYQQSFSVFKTHRYIYSVLKRMITCWENADITNKNIHHAVVLSGVRRIGKTTVLQQLYNELANSVFIDGSELKGDIFEYLRGTLADSDVKYIFIDEVCKLSKDSQNSLISYIKCGSDDKFFILTGSVPYLVDDIADAICSCKQIRMQSIMYIERLAWENGVSLREAIKYSSNEKFLKWVKSGEIKADMDLKYIKGVVSDTAFSYSRHNTNLAKEIFGDRYSEKLLRMMYEYVMACQMLYINETKKGSRFPDTDILQKIQMLRKSLNELKNSLPVKSIRAFCYMLENAYLVHRVSIYDETDSETLRSIESEYYVPAYVFEYPQLLRGVVCAAISGGTLDLWVEYCLLIKASHYYFNVGKYRFTDGTEEVDIVYTLEDIDFTNKCMIEVKNRPERRTKFSKYAGVQMTGIQEFVISCSDQEFQEIQFQSDKFNRVFRMRNDVIVLLLELAFMEKSGVDYYKANLLSELYEKYFNFE